jgi:hypothetical protein
LLHGFALSGHETAHEGAPLLQRSAIWSDAARLNHKTLLLSKVNAVKQLQV